MQGLPLSQHQGKICGVFEKMLGEGFLAFYYALLF